jgi:inner membrane protein
MDTITHAIIGATVARATAPGTTSPDSLNTKQRVGIGALAAAFPDIDYFSNFIHPLAFIAEWHRSVTHSFVMLPIWAITTGFILAWLFKKTANMKEIMVICGLSIVSHILTDLITSWSTQIFSPLSDFSMAWGLTFIIDLYFTGIILLALAIALIKDSRLAARTGIAVLAAYVGFQGILKYQAHGIGQDYVVQQGWQDASIYTMPQPLSPFNWKVVVIQQTQYQMALVNLLRTGPQPEPDRSDATLSSLMRYYRPRDHLRWQTYPQINDPPDVSTVWRRPELELYRKFAVLPYLYNASTNQNERCTWFDDLRFKLPIGYAPFRYGLCRETRTDRWKLYRLVGDGAGMANRKLIPVY